ncbi:hypothetical protein [Moritella viscosa]|uniref:Hypothetical disulfide oxidoreductase n=1 Tax=Moritella viscosa TaxID=80854 RepID=A0ABY1HBG4_9GAMM|nr:hypothetical protein [Moritella viscosa]SGY84405.1 Hypothetical disulfide oxidoreductase [Moritella viscosa]SGY85420.1 Hypothetical disulfide oxidoreductase [Moritella viscosa]SGY86497.1 Hypothetical disulfide oxidoreductase [Moritella viscosa]SHO24590.1 Hypothetical disulfide oxidoreductase [Moritella viscosa]
MKRVYLILKSMFIALLLSQNAIAYADAIEGKHYDKVKNNFYEESLGVEKFFSLTCGPCWKVSTMLPSISKQSQQTIHKTHVVFDKVTRAAATLYYSAEIQFEKLNLKAKSKFTNELFMLVQKSRKIENVNVTDLFRRYQLTPISQLTKEQQAKVNTQLARSEKLTAQATIMQIPSIIVNGTYQVNMRPHKSISELSETIKYLANLKDLMS